VKSLASQPVNTMMLKGAGSLLEKVKVDLDALQRETSPYLRLVGPWLRWVPGYGEDIAAAADLLDMAELTVGAVESLYQVGYPVYEAIQTKQISLNPKSLTEQLLKIQPQLTVARRQMDAAMSVWEKHQGAAFSAQTKGLLKEVERPINLLDRGLAVAVALPKLLGASNDGPKTYMLLVQNEDELRPTGGFITSVGTFVVTAGGIFGMEFVDSGDLEDWSLPYPPAPWQLVEYMDSPVLVLRDANWFPDYPTAAGWIEFLYAYKYDHSVDGIIAINQHLLVSLLEAIGPLTIDAITFPITSLNVISRMREEKLSSYFGDPQRKAFISQIARAVVEKIIAGDNLDWTKLGETMLKNLSERNLLVQVDDPDVTSFLAEWEWDGAVRAETGDFLMIVDTNIGFNKSNAVVESIVTYDIDLTTLAKPTGALVVLQTNQAERIYSCVPRKVELFDKMYSIDYCYWNYLRVYVPAGTQLTNASPHQIPADWMLLQQPVPARVDTLDEKMTGVQGYGTLVVVPGGQTRDTRFTFALPARVVSPGAWAKQYSYSLKIKKQPGTIAIPATVRVHLPPGARVDTVNLKATIDGANILVETNLRNDVRLTVTFTVP
jgi:hypothetical protein